MSQAFDMHSLEFRLPDLGEGLTEAEIVRWLVEVGDFVAVDQPVVEVETAKAMVEVPCPYGGVVTARFGEEGTELPVGAPLLTVAVGPPADGARPGTAAGGTRVPAQVSGFGAGAPGAGGAERAEHGGRTEAGERADSASRGLADSEQARRDKDAGRAAPAADRPGSGAGRTPADHGAAQAPDTSENGGRPTQDTADSPQGEAANAADGGRARTTADATGTRQAEPAEPAGRESGRPSSGAEESSGNVLVGYGTAAAPARRRRVRPPEPAQNRGPVPVISPLVRKLARDHGLDLRELAGSGPDGLILRADVEYAVRAAAGTRAPETSRTAPTRPAPTAPSAPAGRPPSQAEPPDRATPTGQTVGAGQTVSAGQAAGGDTGSRSRPEARSGERIPLRGVRGAVAEKMARSRREIPEATCWVDADATELLAARAAMNAVAGPKISVLALFARICTAALARHPELNSTVDAEAREIVRFDDVHLGFAAQTDRGLVVPVVRDAQGRDAESLSVELARLTDAARAGTLSPAELTGGTFTLNNYGVFGVDGSTPIINHPEAAMLGVGRITPKPWVHEGELAVRQVVQLSLTFDHRVCDGGTAAGFLRFVTECVEQPAVLLRTL
ncbi:2-oxo acid dehydrogenase subunit E2 [Streptomyces sp. TS71-3]|uniref:2-oxo acid dehydrogenase subunit E2 n=1 Tax=Streptomyces sp. TS71-3 TaxID=2733862 RepID=UPI001B0335A2|nr:2-oxo acid dehydrogenase subunit E2 [Streptomyces sp. TS71-3]GHJ40309.1 hypothetical protein Sm713_59180 [Streptomyces sp. TS71-3]